MWKDLERHQQELVYYHILNRYHEFTTMIENAEKAKLVSLASRLKSNQEAYKLAIEALELAEDNGKETT